MRGRKPKPTALKVLEGEKPSRINRGEPEPPPGRPAMPAYLHGDAEAEEAWEEIVAIVEDLGVLTRADGLALGVYCSAYSRLVAARLEYRASVTATTDMGSEKRNPAVAVAKEAEATMLRVLIEFGLTPSSRSRVSTGAQEPEDKLDAFIAAARSRSG